MRDALSLFQSELALAHLLFRPLAFSDIARQRQAEPMRSLLKLASTNLDREHAPVLAPMKSLEGYRFAGVYSLSDPRDRCCVQAGIEVARMHSDHLLAGV